MESLPLRRLASEAVVACSAVLALSACNDTMAGEFEYHKNGTASREYYEQVEGESHVPEKGDLTHIRTYRCTRTENGTPMLTTVDRKTDGSILEENTRPSRACRDMLITYPEIP